MLTSFSKEKLRTKIFSVALVFTFLGVSPAFAEDLGSIEFNGSTQYLVIPNGGDFAFGTEDFTIELWAYESGYVNGNYPRLFSVGTWPGASIALEIDRGGPIYGHWAGRRDQDFGNQGVSAQNTWVHYAMVRSSGLMRVYVNGVQSGAAKTATQNISDASTPMYVARENAAQSGFTGKITNFHVMKGVAKYTADFTPSTQPISPVASTKVLLKFSSSGTLLIDSGPNAKTITNGGASAWNASTPLSAATAPLAPTITAVTGGNKQITIAFTSGADGGAAITDYEYSLNSGSYISAATTASPFTITGLSGRTAYSVTLKARNSVDLGAASSALSATTTDTALDASEAAAEVARLAAIESARVAAEAEAAKKAKEQKELTELLSVIPSIAGLALNLGDLTNSLLSTKCVKGKTVKNVKKGAKCPKGYVKKN
jgi:hypothetical protein